MSRPTLISRSRAAPSVADLASVGELASACISREQLGAHAASSPSRPMPTACSALDRAAPTPGRTLTSRGARKAPASDDRRQVHPSGLCRPEHSLLSSFDSEMPTEVVSPLLSATAALQRSAT